MASWPEIQSGIFKGESGGDYDALFGFSNRPGGQFANTKLTNMTVDQAIAFSDPNGPYAQHVKNQIGRVATPMGAYQVVGNTLKLAKQWAGLRGDELMTREVQDRIGQAILKNQGTGAWAGYKGPSTPGLYSPTTMGGAPQTFQMPAQQEQPAVEMPILPGQDPYKDPNLLTDTEIQSSYGGGAAQAKAEGVPQAFDEPTGASQLGEMFARATPETPMFDTRVASPTLTQPNQVDLSQSLAEVFKLKPYGQAGIDKATGLP